MRQRKAAVDWADNDGALRQLAASRIQHAKSAPRLLHSHLSAEIALAGDLVRIATVVSWAAVVQHKAVIVLSNVEVRPDRHCLDVPALPFALGSIRSIDEQERRVGSSAASGKISVIFGQFRDSVAQQKDRQEAENCESDGKINTLPHCHLLLSKDRYTRQ